MSDLTINHELNFYLDKKYGQVRVVSDPITNIVLDFWKARIEVTSDKVILRNETNTLRVYKIDELNRGKNKSEDKIYYINNTADLSTNYQIILHLSESDGSFVYGNINLDRNDLIT